MQLVATVTKADLMAMARRGVTPEQAVKMLLDEAKRRTGRDCVMPRLDQNTWEIYAVS